MAAGIVALVVACAAPIPDLRPPPERRTEIPESDVAVNEERILETHNSIRRQLGVPELRWSTQMQVYATEWALFLSREGGCELRYRGSIGLPLHKNGLGENLYFHEALVASDGSRRRESIDGRIPVLDWARQAEHFNYIDNTCALNQRCDGYTQLVWSDSAVVGCGAASCPNNDQIWVCNYDPPGNFNLQRPY
jgi:pathogenesis-related protein 1